MSKVKIRKAVLNDADEIANVLLDFYNIEDQEEAKKIFIDEQKKEFQYLIAAEDDQVLGLVTWITHGLPKHGLFELDRICIMTNARGKGIGKKLVNELIPLGCKGIQNLMNISPKLSEFNNKRFTTTELDKADLFLKDIFSYIYQNLLILY